MKKDIVEEIPVGRGIGYVVTSYGFDGKVKSRKTVYCLVRTVTVDEYEYILVYDHEGNLNEAIFNFINVYHHGSAIGTRLKICDYLKIFAEFSAIINKPWDRMEYNDFTDFTSFLAGENIVNSKYDFSLLTPKSAEREKTILSYCKAIMKYCRYRKATKELERIKPRRISSLTPAKVLCPKFISVKQFIDICEYLKVCDLPELDKKKYECIYRLMYNYGLRSGEVLGLTLEDFQPGINDEGREYCLIKIRNRFSNNRDQCAKRCMKINSPRDYKNPDYSVYLAGYQTVVTSIELYNDIMDMYDQEAILLKRKGLKMPKADAVEGKGENTYVFVNACKPTPLNVDILLSFTRKMFTELGIPIDSKTRQNNLLHRFRHGFVMRLLYVDRMPGKDVILYSRHASEAELAPYNNPTEEEIRDVLLNIEESREHYFYEETQNWNKEKK